MAQQFLNSNVASVAMLPSSDGQYLIAESSPRTRTFNGPGGQNDTITITDAFSGLQFKYTFTFTGNNITSESGWVKQ